VIYPNSDPGHTGIIEAIEKARKEVRLPTRVERSLVRDEYLRLLAESRVLVGNSSSGIIEAASAGTPAVNVGDRQAGRQRSGSSVVDCGETLAEIAAAIRAAMSKRPRAGARTCYGDGRAGERIARALAKARLDERLRRKQIAY
jgi:GDP/UDP-N,N'-diacetylbacillosamine 2-epimerase (hydrolysing)